MLRRGTPASGRRVPDGVGGPGWPRNVAPRGATATTGAPVCRASPPLKSHHVVGCPPPPRDRARPSRASPVSISGCPERIAIGGAGRLATAAAAGWGAARLLEAPPARGGWSRVAAAACVQTRLRSSVLVSRRCVGGDRVTSAPRRARPCPLPGAVERGGGPAPAAAAGRSLLFGTRGSRGSPTGKGGALATLPTRAREDGG